VSANVVSLHGDIPPGVGPNADAVEMLRRYLEQAERGEVSAVAIAAVRPNDATSTAWSSVPGECKYGLHSAAVRLAHEITTMLMNGAETEGD
jgi:hypothetical protein